MPQGLHPQKVAFKLPLRDGGDDEAPPDGLWVIHDLRTNETKTQRSRPRGAKRTISGKRTPHRSYVVIEEGPTPTERQNFVLGAMVYNVGRGGIGMKPVAKVLKRARKPRMRVARSTAIRGVGDRMHRLDRDPPPQLPRERPIRQKDLDEAPLG